VHKLNHAFHINKQDGGATESWRGKQRLDTYLQSWSRLNRRAAGGNWGRPPQRAIGGMGDLAGGDRAAPAAKEGREGNEIGRCFRAGPSRVKAAAARGTTGISRPASSVGCRCGELSCHIGKKGKYEGCLS
jgi:hypothetical protein